MAGLKLNLLGQMECGVADGTTFKLSTRKAEVLLAYLALAQGVRQPRERLSNLLWSDRSEDQARNSLRQTLSVIKKKLESINPALLEIERTTVKLDTNLLQVDALEFEALCTESDNDSLSRAFALYQGEFLEGITVRDSVSQDWLANTRDRFGRQLVEMLISLGELQLTDKNFKATIESAEFLVNHDALQETGWRLLMRAHQANGDRNHALQAYKRCRDVLASELGVEPEEETNQLRDLIRDGKTSPSPNKITESPSHNITKSELSNKDHAILVLPFKNLSNDADQQYFSDGLTESIITSLTLFPSIRVHSRNTSFAAQDQVLSVAQIGQKFQVSYVIEGSVRKSQDQIRVSVQLINADNGEQTWGKQFDNSLDNTFEMEDQVTRSIVAAIKGKIDATDQQIAIRNPTKNMQSYDLLLRAKFHIFRFNPEDYQIGIALLQDCVALDPDNALVHNNLYLSYITDWMSRWSHPHEKTLEKAAYHINRALDLDPNNASIQSSYAEYSMFIEEWDQGEQHADKAIRLNPNDPEVLATVSAAQASLGNIEKALELSDTCRQLDPFHPWIDWVAGPAYYRAKRYQDALATFANMPIPADEIDGWIAACYQRLGDSKKAETYLNRYLETSKNNMAQFPESLNEWEKLWKASASFRYEEGIDYPFDALCEAGLGDLIGSSNKLDSSDTSHNIAVLPFDNLSGDPEQEYFSDGITESIILNLSLFPSLNVKSRNSSFAFKQQIKDLGEISKELNVEYIVEGSIRKSTDRIRITVELIEASTGNQIWGKRYNSDLSDLFDLEEELSRTIAATVTGRIESDIQCIAIAKSAPHQRSYDLLLAGKYHYYKFTREDIAISREKLEYCLESEPDNVHALALMYACHTMDWMERWVEDYQRSFDLAGEFIRKALNLGPDIYMVQNFYAEYMIFCRDNDAASHHVEKALAINPNDPDGLATKAFNLNAMGQFESAFEIAQKCLQLDPYHPWVEWIIAEVQLYTGHTEESIHTNLNSKTTLSYLRALLVVAYSKLGDSVKARQAMQQFLAACRETMLSMPNSKAEWESYWSDNMPYRDTELTGNMIDHLMRAGLCDELEISKNNLNSDNHPVIAVLPFDNLSGDPEQEYFSDGITESIILNLSLFPELTVKSRNSSFGVKQRLKNLGEISEELNVNYLVEGSIRKSTDRIRITVQLIEAATGNQVWGKRYDAEIENLFDLEEELSRTIAATVTGQIESNLQGIAINKGAAHQKSYELLLAGAYHCNKFSRPDMLIAIEKLNRCLQLDPNNIRAHTALFTCHSINSFERWVVDHEESFALAGEHIKKALSLGPEIGFVLNAYSEYLTFSGQYAEAQKHANKSFQINPNDPDALTMKAFTLSMTGKFEQALELVELSSELDPYNPWTDWFRIEILIFTGQYNQALDILSSSSTATGFIRVYKVVAYIKLDQLDLARQALKDFLKECHEAIVSIPQTIEDWLLYTKANSPFQDERFNQEIVDCLIQAGLEETSDQSLTTDVSDQRPSLLVLPFGNLSGDQEQDYFSDGITESVILNLSSFSGLNVKSRHASFAFKDSSLGIDEIAKELNVQYIVDGSIRKHGDQVRITVQLSDTQSGNQIWGKRFDTPLADLFELEEELVQTIAGTISGKIDREIKTSSYRKPTKDLRSYDYLMRAWYHVERFLPKECLIALDLLNRCLEIDPDNVEANTLIAGINNVLLYENWTEDRQQTKATAKKHILKALEIDPNHAFAHTVLSYGFLFEKDFKTALFHVDKTIELNPALPDGYSIKASILSSQGRLEQAVEIAKFSMQIDPYHYYIGWDAGSVYSRAGLFEQAIEAFQSIPMLPTSLLAETAACQFALGDEVKARATMKKYHQLAREQMPNFPSTVEAWRSLWYDNEPFESDSDFDIYFNRLLEAGLCDDVEEAVNDIPSILVLPFENMSGDPEQDYFSDGITESIVLHLSSFNGLKVKSRHTSFAHRNSPKSIQEIGLELDIQYVIEGSIRKSGDKVKITVQLTESTDANQLWGKQFNSDLENIFSLEEELVQTITGTISGRIGKDIKDTSLKKPTKDLKSYDYYLRGCYHLEKFTPEDLISAREFLLKSLEIDPDNARAHIYLSLIHDCEFVENWSSNKKDSLSLSRTHADKAIELEPDDAFVHAYLAEHLYYSREYDRGDFHCNKAIELNPALPDGYSLKAHSMALYCRFDEALENNDISVQLDPDHPFIGWTAGEVYRACRLYERAINAFRSLSHKPTGIYAQIAACLAALDKMDEAKSEMSIYLEKAKREMPNYPTSVEAWRTVWYDTIPYKFQEDFEEFFNLLSKAGLCDEVIDSTVAIPSIAVLPFENMSDDPEQAYFSDGITSDLISSLSRLRNMRVVARQSILSYKDRETPIAQIAEQQQVRYLLDGNIRKSGNRVRVNVQLIDTNTGENCWVENYDRNMDDIFAVQDEITQNITVAMRVQLTDGERARGQAVGTQNIKAWQLITNAYDLSDSYIKSNIFEARRLAEAALELDSGYCLAWVTLGWTYWQEAYCAWSESIDDSLDQVEIAIQKAINIDPDSAEALILSGSTHSMRNRPEKAIIDSQKAAIIAPNNAEVQALASFAYIYNGQYEQAQIYIDASLRLSPIYPNWYMIVSGEIALHCGSTEKAIEDFQLGIDLEPESTLVRYYLINALITAGKLTKAKKVAQEIKALDPSFGIAGFIRSYSHDETKRNQFQSNLEKVGFKP